MTFQSRSFINLSSSFKDLSMLIVLTCYKKKRELLTGTSIDENKLASMRPTN